MIATYCLALFEGMILLALGRAWIFNHDRLKAWRDLDATLATEFSRQVGSLRTIADFNLKLSHLRDACPALVAHPPALAEAQAQAVIWTRMQDLEEFRIKNSFIRLIHNGFEKSIAPTSVRFPPTNPCHLPENLTYAPGIIARAERPEEFAGAQLENNNRGFRWNFYSSRGLPR